MKLHCASGVFRILRIISVAWVNNESRNMLHFMTHSGSTHLQIYLQALVIDLCFKRDKMQFLSDNQRGLENKKQPT